MTHTYKISGMTCGGCEASVKNSLQALPNVTSVEVSRGTNTATISMEKYINLPDLQHALGGSSGNYQISNI